VPTTADDVFFSNLSTGTCSIAVGNTGAKSINCTGFTGTLQVGATITVAGSITLVAGMTFTSIAVVTITGTGTITSAGKLFTGVQINGSGITVTLGDALTINTLSVFTLTQGTLALNGFTLSTGRFSSNNSNTRAITFGSSNIALTSTTAADTVLSMPTATNFTYTGTGGFTRNMAATATVEFGSTAGGTTTNAPNLTVNAGASDLTITANSWFNNLIFTGNTSTVTASAVNIAGIFTLATGGTYTAVAPTFQDTSSFTTNGKTVGDITINAPGGTVTLLSAVTTGVGNTTTLTAGTLLLNNNTLTTGIFSSSNVNTREIQFGIGNIALTSTTASTTILSMAGASNFTYTGTGGFTRNMAATATVVFGTTGGATSTNAPNLTVNAGASALTITSNSYFNNLVFTGSTSTVTSTQANIAGDLTLATGGTYTALNPIYRDTGTLTSNGKTIGSFGINGSGITVTLGDALTVFGSSVLTQGTLNLGGFTLSTSVFSSTNTNTRAITFGSANIALTSTTPAATVLNIADATNFTYTGTGGFTRVQSATASIQCAYIAGSIITNLPNFTVTSGASDLTITGTSQFKAFTLTGSTCSVIGNALFYGTLTVASGGTYTSFSPVLLTTQSFTSFGKTFYSFQVIGSGITVTLSDALTVDTVGAFTLTSGTLNLNGFTLSAGIFSSDNSNTRAITFGSANIALTSTSAGTAVLSMGTLNNFTYTGTGGFTRVQGATATLDYGSNGGASSTNAVNMTVTSGASALTVSGSSHFKAFTLTGSTCTVVGTATIYSSLVFASGGTYTGLSVIFAATQTFSSLGKTIEDCTVSGTGITVTLGSALTLGTSRIFTLTEGTINLNGFTLSTGSFSSNNSNTRAITFGSANIALTNTVAATTVLNMATATGFTYTGTGGFTRNMAATATVVFGTTGGSTTNAPNINFNAGASALTITANSWFNNLIFNSTSSSTVTASAVNITGDLTLDSGGTYTAVVPTYRDTGTLTNSGKTLSALTVNGSGITVTCADALTTTGALTLTNGTLKLKNGVTSTVGSLVTTGTTLKYLESASAGTQATISDTTGTNTVTYLSIKDSNATGGAVFDATSATNVNAGNNTGWAGFVSGGGNFLMFFM